MSRFEVAVAVIRKRFPFSRTDTLPSWLATQPASWSRWEIPITSCRNLGRWTNAISEAQLDRVDDPDDQRPDRQRLVLEHLAHPSALAHHQHGVARARGGGVIDGDERLPARRQLLVERLHHHQPPAF